MPANIFIDYMQPVLVREGERFTDNPLDHGGATKWGITYSRARAAGYGGLMQDLTLERAMDIYRLFYWEQPMFDKIVPLVPNLAKYLLDIGINQGTNTVSKYPQRALNVLNAGASLWEDVEVDGVFGAMSRAALSSFLQRRGVEGSAVLIDMVQAQASVRYMEIAETKKDQEVWEWGWQKRAFQVAA